MIRVIPRKSGFTIIELLVVIAIIGLLATIATFGSMQAKNRARDARTKEDLSTIRSAMSMLLADTGKWPNGCPADAAAGSAVALTSAQAGMLATPTVGDQGDGCFWTDDDINNWNGPYATFTKDPWGNEYYFDQDYQPYLHCPSQEGKSGQPAVISFGPNGVGLDAYDCDDLWLPLE